ncbi:hypothetical protein I4U23_015146 [Adineta vaga]|nr:hypothetical protein I4U23_015146 [Adineta vaga]
MFSTRIVLLWHISIVCILYLLQGFIQGFAKSIPLYLASYKASWKEQGTFSWVSYPYSFKILWAPVMDSVYSRRFGRHQTWLIPIQFFIGIILFILAFYLESLLINLRAVALTSVFFVLYFLISSQDIVVDGWAVSLFNDINPQWASTCQIIGQTFGIFIGSTILMIFESSNFTNKYIRSPLSLPNQSYGLFSLRQFTIFWAILFLVVSILLLIMSFYEKQSNKITDTNYKNEPEAKLKILETYLDILKLLKKRCMQKLILITVTFSIGFAATNFMTDLTLLGYGITRDTLALVNIPLILARLLAPVCLSKTRRPLIWFTRGYIPRLVACLILAIYIFFTPQLLQTSFFYPILIVLFCLNELFVYLMTVSIIGFFARISEPRIGGTYMTLLATLYNLGHALSSTLVLYIAEWLPKAYAYSIEIGVCLLFGLIWIILMWHMVRDLGTLPIEDWYLKPSAQQ